MPKATLPEFLSKYCQALAGQNKKKENAEKLQCSAIHVRGVHHAYFRGIRTDENQWKRVMLSGQCARQKVKWSGRKTKPNDATFCSLNAYGLVSMLKGVAPCEVPLSSSAQSALISAHLGPQLGT